MKVSKKWVPYVAQRPNSRPSKNQSDIQVYLRTTLPTYNTIIRPSRVKYWDLNESELIYINRMMNAEKKETVNLLVILPMYSRYLAVSFPIPNQSYSGWTVLPVVTPRSTRSLFFVLFRVRRFILSSPSQNSPTKLPKPCLYSFQVRLKSTEPSILFWITVHPPLAVVWSQYTLKAPEPSGSIV